MTAVGWFRPDDPGFVARLDAPQREALAGVVDQVVTLLGGPAAADAGPFALGGAPVPPPTDPAVRRLLPDASRADPEVAAEFRRFTEADLRASKITQLLGLRDALAGDDDRVVVPREAAPAVAAALTDVRLVVADRLGLRTDADAEALQAMLVAAEEREDDDVPFVVVLAAVYDLLGLLQATLVDCLLDALDEGPDADPDGRSG